MNYPPSQTYGTCDKCGGAKVKNPKTGKIFCENKCWLNQPTAQTPQPKPQYSNYPPTPTPPTNGRDYDKENFGKCKFGFLIEAYKMGKTLDESELEAELFAEASMRKL